MSGLTDEQIWKVFGLYLTENSKGQFDREDIPTQFTLDDLVGRTISGHRKIKNPILYNPKKESSNPEYFDVLEFTDGSILLTDNWGDMECGHIHQYLYNGKEVLATEELFGGV